MRPHGVHELSLIDDLSRGAIRRMRKSGFQPALVVETSPGNFQAWLNHGRILDCELSSQAAKKLARRFGGDPFSADWRHFGRLAGFTNQKPRRRLENGLAPFVRVRECVGRVYDVADDFIKSVAALAATTRAEREARRTSESLVCNGSIRPLHAFHSDPRYDGALHRADMAWALYAAGRGLSGEEIVTEILRARDLSKKGGVRRQVDYAERTASKAVATASLLRA